MQIEKVKTELEQEKVNENDETGEQDKSRIKTLRFQNRLSMILLNRLIKLYEVKE